ncbi:hypothetical protein QTL97_09195 [Sporosarcina thermotolerans]|uniref:Uncharacterized protein n=1 Tax=Sporosarcina thermotolerans TaxID=633404 RepID=A0AAW9A7Z1_9BACL|nr:hypothetical protein [Sporosarcina thermotolerans]MDW0117110.1 hypothetical protein [Sporosarcina thermotolerans]WHT47799.1 hypothetical protein QNH10_17110 [Sporosarcina thermotolerans]
MSIFTNVSLIVLFPATLLLLTLEIVLGSYKALYPQWTTKLAISNLFLNILWMLLIVYLLLNPNLIRPYLAESLAKVFQRSPEDITTQVSLIIMGVGLSSIATTIIDSFMGFKHLRTERIKQLFK